MSSGTVLRAWPGYPSMISEPRHLHLLSILLSSLRLLKDILLPLVIYFITAIAQRGFSTAWLLVTGTVIILAALAWGVLGWYRFTYRVDKGALVVEQGVLVHKRSLIPRERIQSIDLNQGLWHRLFNIVAVQVETAGGSAPEAVLSALTLSDAEALRHELLVSGVKPGSDCAEPAVPLKSAALSELFLFGATSGGALGLVLSLFSGALTLLDDIGLELNWQQYYNWVWGQANLVYPVLLLLLALWLLTALGMLLKYGGFTLTRTGDRLQMVYGLLQRRQISIPVGRIQAVRLVEGVLRQPLGYLSIYVESAGYGQKSREKTLLWPLVRQRELAAILGEFLPEFAREIPLQPLPAQAGRRYVLRFFIPLFLLAVPALLWLPWGGLALTLPLLGGLWGFWVYRSAAWGVRDNMLAVRSRSLARTTFVVPNRKAQSLTVGFNPWQRWAGLLNFELDLASQASFGLRDINVTDAETLTGWFKKC